MPRLSDLIADSDSMDIEFDHGVIRVEYRPRVVTSEWQVAIGLAEERGDDLEAMLYRPLKDALISWDLENDDGEIIPLESEAMASIPRQILLTILIAIVGTSRPNLQRTLGTSRDGLATRPSQRLMSTRNGIG